MTTHSVTPSTQARRSSPPQKAPTSDRQPGIPQRGMQPRTQLMRLDQWAAIPEFPKQRNTVLHADHAAKSFLSGPWNPAWDTVAAVVFPDGSLCKLDGHTRDLLWRDGRIALPPTGKVTCHIYPVDSLEEAERLYYAFNSKQSAKNTADFIYGELRGAGALDTLQTTFLRSGNLSEALRLSTGTSDIQRSVPAVIEALGLLDALNPKKRLFRSGILGAAILTIRAHGKAALEHFWEPYNRREYLRKGNRVNGPGAIEERARELTMARIYGRDIEKAINQYALHVYNATGHHKMVVVPRTISLETALNDMLLLPKPSQWAAEWGVSWGKIDDGTHAG